MEKIECRYCAELARFLVTDPDETMALGACQFHLRRVIEAVIGVDDQSNYATVMKFNREE